jgi:hypothetical protein
MTQSITGTELAAEAALDKQFRVAFLRINATAASLLRDDLIALAHEEELTFEQAARELEKRIGGAAYLASYAGTLVAQAQRRQRLTPFPDDREGK